MFAQAIKKKNAAALRETPSSFRSTRGGAVVDKVVQFIMASKMSIQLIGLGTVFLVHIICNVLASTEGSSSISVDGKSPTCSLEGFRIETLALYVNVLIQR